MFIFIYHFKQIIYQNGLYNKSWGSFLSQREPHKKEKQEDKGGKGSRNEDKQGRICSYFMFVYLGMFIEGWLYG